MNIPERHLPTCSPGSVSGFVTEWINIYPIKRLKHIDVECKATSQWVFDEYQCLSFAKVEWACLIRISFKGVCSCTKAAVSHSLMSSDTIGATSVFDSVRCFSLCPGLSTTGSCQGTLFPIGSGTWKRTVVVLWLAPLALCTHISPTTELRPAAGQW